MKYSFQILNLYCLAFGFGGSANTQSIKQMPQNYDSLYKLHPICLLQDLERCVEEDFPKGTELTKLEQQHEAHNAFAEARCRVYIGRQEYFTGINDNRAKGENKPFVLLGESGM